MATAVAIGSSSAVDEVRHQASRDSIVDAGRTGVWGGIPVILYAIVVGPLTSHPYKAGTSHRTIRSSSTNNMVTEKNVSECKNGNLEASLMQRVTFYSVVANRPQLSMLFSGERSKAVCRCGTSSHALLRACIRLMRSCWLV